MDVASRVENALERHLAGRLEPKTLGAAMRHALFPGGARVRPKFALGVAAACGDDRPDVSDALAAAVEFLHCASLVHDDLPCFDDSDTRRGQPSVHAAFGEPVAVLVGDGLIVAAFQALADVGTSAADRLPALLSVVAESAGAPRGLVAGQAMESEDGRVIGPYHAAKTGALFRAAAAGGAIAAGADRAPWEEIGEHLGAAYQIADDIHDAVGKEGSLGKPTGQDGRLDRPSSVEEWGLDEAIRRLRALVTEAADTVPAGEHGDALRDLIKAQTKRFLPPSLASRAA